MITLGVIFVGRRTRRHGVGLEFTRLLSSTILPEAERKFLEQFEWGMPDPDGHVALFQQLFIRRAEILVVREIGSGQFGSVYMVKRKKDGKKCFPPFAGKEANFETSGDIIGLHRALLFEAHVLLELRHPNVSLFVQLECSWSAPTPTFRAILSAKGLFGGGESSG